MIFASDKDGLVDFEAEDFRVKDGDGRAVDTNETPTFLGMGNCSCGLESKSKVGLDK